MVREIGDNINNIYMNPLFHPPKKARLLYKSKNLAQPMIMVQTFSRLAHKNRTARNQVSVNLLVGPPS